MPKLSFEVGLQLLFCI